MTKFYSVFVLLLLGMTLASAQEAASTPQKPTEHLLGTIIVMDTAARTVTVKDDKSGSEQVIELAGTKTLLKVTPGAKDLTSASRITAAELAVGDRVDVRGFKAPDDPAKIAARSVVLMSARDLQVAHRAQAQEWQNSKTGSVSAIDATGKITIRERTPEGPQSVILQTSPQTEFSRYSVDKPDSPQSSTLGQVQVGDQLRVLGDAGPDGTITARKIYSAPFRTVNGTVVSIAADSKQFTIKDLASKRPLQVNLNESSTVRRIPPEMAAGLARRMGGGARAAGPGATPPGTNASASPASSGGMPGAHGPRGGDISQMLDRLPAITLADLKPGDAVVVSGVSTGGDQLIATHVVAGVEPILQAAPASRRGGDAMGGDWGLGEIAPPQQ